MNRLDLLHRSEVLLAGQTWDSKIHRIERIELVMAHPKMKGWWCCILHNYKGEVNVCRWLTSENSIYRNYSLDKTSPLINWWDESGTFLERTPEEFSIKSEAEDNEYGEIDE